MANGRYPQQYGTLITDISPLGFIGGDN